jgi:hypothetical protein
VKALFNALFTGVRSQHTPGEAGGVAQKPGEFIEDTE